MPIRMLLLLLLGLVLLPAAVHASDRELAALRAVLDAQQEAWNRGDLEGYMRGYWDSESLSFYGGGDVTRGYAATLARYRRRYQSEGREMGRLALGVADVTRLGRSDAIVRGSWRLGMRDGSTPHGVYTLWMRRIPGQGWRIVHDHSSSATP